MGEGIEMKQINLTKQKFSKCEYQARKQVCEQIDNRVCEYPYWQVHDKLHDLPHEQIYHQVCDQINEELFWEANNRTIDLVFGQVHVQAVERVYGRPFEKVYWDYWR